MLTRSVGLVLMLHGFGHFLGAIPMFRATPGDTWHLRSWLTSPTLGEKVSVVVGALLFATCGVIFLLSGPALGAVVIPFEWWRPLTDGGAVLSLTSVLLYWNALPTLTHKVLVLTLDLLVVGNWLQIWDWPI